MIGQSISHYKILEKLGEGGMGVVYKAEDTTLKRTVALKFLPQNVSASENDKARFMIEAQAAAALNHPNICTIYAIEEHDGPASAGKQIFISMELIEGQTLKERQGTISLAKAIEVGIQVAEGLSAAHEKGIVHRDIKPENIMLRKDGIAQIMDFGLAKLRASRASRLTKEGSTVGTAGFMAPEQVQGMDTDHRSDIFSLGVLLYELFTGELPFKGVHETALMYEIVNVDPAPMSTVKPEIDPELDRIVLECLQKEPDERYQSAKDISKDLKRFKRESSRTRVSRITAARPAIKIQQSSESVISEIPVWKKLLWPVIAIASIIVLVVWSPWKQEAPPPVVTRVAITLPKDQILSTTSYSAVAISPDGSHLVYKASSRLYLRRMDSFESTPLPGTEDGSGPFFSPDGKWIGFFAAGKLKKVPISGGATITLANAEDNRGATWGKRGDIVFTPQAVLGLILVREGGGEPRQLTVVDSTKNERTHRWPHFLPDGKTVMYTIGAMDSPDFYDDAVIEAVDIETGARKILMKGGCSAQYVPSGFLIYWRSSSLFAVAFDINTLEVTGTSFPVVENVNGDPTTAMAGYTISQNGVLAYIPGNAGVTNQSLVKADLHGVMTPLAAPLQSYIEPRFSPDGERIAVTIQSGKDADIWVYDIPRNTLSKFTFGGTNRTPAWSPDGKQIAYYMFDNGKHFVMSKQSDGSGVPEIIAQSIGRTYIDAWSKDGTTLLLDIPGGGRVGQTGPGGSDIYMISLTGNPVLKPVLVTKFDEWQGSISPDGKLMAYTSNESGTYQVYIQPLPQGGGRWAVSSDEGYAPHWSPDGKILYYYSPGKMISVPIQTTPSLIVGKPQILFSGYQQKSVDSGLMYDLSPDGKYFVVTQSKDDDQNLRQIHLVLNWFGEIQSKMP